MLKADGTIAVMYGKEKIKVVRNGAEITKWQELVAMRTST